MGGGGGGGGLPLVALGFEAVHVDTLAGDAPGYQDGPGWQARFCGPNALALAPDGTLFVADSRNHRIRKVLANGHVSTEAGGGPADGAGGKADGPAATARFRYPSGVAVGKDGTLYVSDTGNHRICRVRDGQVTTLAGGAEGKADGVGAAAQFRSPAALTLDSGGALWVADVGNGIARRIDPDGRVTTPAAPPADVQASLGEFGAGGTHSALIGSKDGVNEPLPSPFKIGRRSATTGPPGAPHIFADTEYHVLVAARGSEPPLLVAGRRVVGTVAVGTLDTLGNRATFARPCAVAVTKDGTALVAEYEGNRIRRVRMPEWIMQGAAMPERQVPGAWRTRRGR
jgi:hypothetical protein